MNLSHGRRPPPPYNPERNREQPFDNPPPRHVCRCGENCFNATELDAHIYLAGLREERDAGVGV
jgi:hypothetical protein